MAMVKGNSLEKYGKFTRFFNGLMYFAIICEGLLFLTLGVGWLLRKDEYNAGGGGMGMALLYTGPILMLNFVTIIMFIALSLSASNNKKYNRTWVMKQYKKSALLFGIEFLIGISANLVLFT